MLNIQDIWPALARATRFNLLKEDLSRPAARPVSRLWLVAIRALMGLAYGLLASLLMMLVRNHAAGALIATAAVLALHCHLTDCRENGVAIALLPPDADSTQRLIVRAMPPLLLFLLLLWGTPAWIVPVLALGAAASVELNHPAASEMPRELGAWALAAAASLLAMVLPVLNSPQARQHRCLATLTVSILVLLLTPWLRRIPRRPAGFSAAAFIGEMTALVLAILASIF